MLAIIVCIASFPETFSQAEKPPHQTHGNFETSDGSKCVWFEMRQKREETILTNACHCKNEQGETQSFSCQYEGDLTNCDAYKANSKELFMKIMNRIKGENSKEVCMRLRVSSL